MIQYDRIKGPPREIWALCAGRTVRVASAHVGSQHGSTFGALAARLIVQLGIHLQNTSLELHARGESAWVQESLKCQNTRFLHVHDLHM